MICFDLAIDQIAQSGLSSLKVIYYSAQLFSLKTSIKTITYLSDTGCLEIQGASLLRLNTYVSLARNTYWDASSNVNYSLSLSRDFDIGPLKNVSASLTFSRINWEEDNQDQLYLNISIPWGTSRTLSYGMQRNQDNKISHTASWYDSSDRNNSWSVSASGDNDEFKDMKASLRASYQHNTENGRLYLSGTSQRDSYYSLNASWNGSFTATRHGAAFHDYSGSADSRFMIDADGAEDIPLNNKRAVTNRYGIGVIPSVSSYITTSLSVDTRNLPENVDIENSVITTTLTEGAIGYAKLDTPRAIKSWGLFAWQMVVTHHWGLA
ncbi:putative outer membrane usher protein [Shigella sonnei]|nr:putative outer membrane usher protein [Shigella sonnei]CSI57410.1 putative outer membrane usher protein [Shigella sonnei]CSI83844.1 putative outer membrane usher protein [Shigella sonnei]CSI92924.1 putative outer membrane usher protein [Shigella sonnei]SRW35772.1 putative outer membrane usher protein [Shigella sonnei]